MQRIATAVALVLTAAAGQAQAEVTPQQVWDDFEAYMAGFGYAVSAEEERAGGRLTLSDLTLEMAMPEEEGQVTIRFAELTLSETGEGAVAISYPARMPVVMTVTEAGQTLSEMTFDMTQSGLEMVVSGAPEDMVYDYAAQALGLELVQLRADGEMVAPEDYEVSLDLGPVAGTQRMTLEEGLRRSTQDVTLGEMRYRLRFDEPGGTDSGSFSGQFTGLSAKGSMALPQAGDYEDPAALIGAGMMVDMVLAHQGGDNRFSVTDAAGTAEGAFTSRGGELGVAVDAEALTYALSAEGQTLALSGPDMPLPVNAELAEFGFSLSLPLAAAETPQPAALSLLLQEFSMGEALWGIFDPQGTLPRDPATVAINLDAEVTPEISLIDTDKMVEFGEAGKLPGELNRLTLRDLAIEAVGAVITGAGEFTFDNADLESFGGLPRPMGEVNLSMAGANGLIDALTAMGLMQPSDAMGARMMLGMFTVPGSEPDTVTSKIEVTEEGHVLANGQRIK